MYPGNALIVVKMYIYALIVYSVTSNQVSLLKILSNNPYFYHFPLSSKTEIFPYEPDADGYTEFEC